MNEWGMGVGMIFFGDLKGCNLGIYDRTVIWGENWLGALDWVVLVWGF